MLNTVKRLFVGNIRQYGMFIALALIMLFFQIITDGTLLKPLNITNLVLQNSYILILAIGMLLVIITGHIDLSVGSVAAFVGAVSAIMMVNYNIHFGVAIVLSLLIGAAAGAWQGFWVAYVKILSFIVTLAGVLLFRGLTMLVLDGKSVAPFPDGLRAISTGFLPGFSRASRHLLTIMIGVGLSLLFVLMGWRKGMIDPRYQLEVHPLGKFI